MDQIKYNINGIGNIEPVFYGKAKELFFDEMLNISENLQNIKQLGSISSLHKGANFTRYEYVLLQIVLVNIVSKTANIGLSSKVNKSFFNGDKNLEDCFKKMTKSEIIQVMIILGNMGHFGGTYSPNKVWFHILRYNINGVKTSFKKD